MIKLTKKLLSFKDTFKPSIKKIFDKYNDVIIKEIYIMRKPIQQYLRNALNILSIGQFEENIKKLDYDKIFHLFMIVILENNIKILMEKNQRINIEIINDVKFNELINDSNIDKIKIDINDKFNLIKFINSGLSFMGNDDFFIYSSYKNNCQKWIYNMLLSNNLMKNEYEKFILQDIKGLFKNMGLLKPISDVLTNLGAIGDYIISGGKIDNKYNDLKLHTILFDKKYYTIDDAKNWLKNNGYKNSKMRNMKNYFRFIQLGNKYIKSKYNVDKYYTINNDKLKIQYIIGYH